MSLLHKLRAPGSLTVNVLSGAFANLGTAAIHLVFTGACAFFLGPEAFGIVAFSTTVLLTVVFLNQFTTPVVVRTLAAQGSDPEGIIGGWQVLRSFELVSVGTGIAIGILIAAGAPLLARYGLKGNHVSQQTVLWSVQLIGLQIACQWPSYFYRAGFVGLARQDVFASIAVPFAALQSGGALLLLWLVSPDLLLLFCWLAATSLAYSLVLRVLLLRHMPPAPEKIGRNWKTPSSVWRFSAGTLVIGLGASLLTQTDKLVISTFVPLSVFSAYSLASMLAVQVVTVVASPLTVSLLPRFSALFSSAEQRTLAAEYHRWTQLLMVIMLPVLGVLFAFGDPVLKLWLGAQSPLVPLSSQFLPVLSIGTMFSIMMIPPYLLQMSVGWSSLLAGFNVCAWGLMIVALLVGVPRVGALAGAYCWLALNVGYYLVMVPLMHRRLIPQEKWLWWTRDTLLPWAVNLSIFLISARFGSPGRGLVVSLMHAAVTAAVSGGVLIAMLPAARTELRRLSAGAY